MNTTLLETYQYQQLQFFSSCCSDGLTVKQYLMKQKQRYFVCYAPALREEEKTPFVAHRAISMPQILPKPCLACHESLWSTVFDCVCQYFVIGTFELLAISILTCISHRDTMIILFLQVIYMVMMIDVFRNTVLLSN